MQEHGPTVSSLTGLITHFCRVQPWGSRPLSPVFPSNITDFTQSTPNFSRCRIGKKKSSTYMDCFPPIHTMATTPQQTEERIQTIVPDSYKDWHNFANWSSLGMEPFQFVDGAVAPGQTEGRWRLFGTSKASPYQSNSTFLLVSCIMSNNCASDTILHITNACPSTWQVSGLSSRLVSCGVRIEFIWRALLGWRSMMPCWGLGRVTAGSPRLLDFILTVYLHGWLPLRLLGSLSCEYLECLTQTWYWPNKAIV